MPPTRSQHLNDYYSSSPYLRQQERQHRALAQHDERCMFSQPASLRTARDPTTSKAVDVNAFPPQLQKGDGYLFVDPTQTYDPVGLHHMPLPPESRLWRPNPVARGDREEEPLPFYAPIADTPLVDSNGHAYHVCIGIEGHKGFFRGEDEEWTCYRRNYFAMSCAYGAAKDDGTEIKSHETCLVYVKELGECLPVVGFAMNMTARVYDDPSKPIALVQHTAKRDKGPINTPTYIPIPPTLLWQIRYGASRFSPGSGAQAVTQASQTSNFERLQFKKATANNGKRRAAQQHYEIEVSVSAGVKDASGSIRWIKVASRKSHRIVVRGRSPGHYHKDRLTEKEDKRFSGGRGLHPGLMQHPFPTLPGFNAKNDFSYADGSSYTQMFGQPQIPINPLLTAQELASESAEDENEDQISDAHAPSPGAIDSDGERDGYRFYPGPNSHISMEVDGSSKPATMRGTVSMTHTQNLPREQPGFAGRNNTGPFDTETLSQYSRPTLTETEGFQPCHVSAMTNPIRSAYAEMDSSIITEYGLQSAMPTAG